MRIKIWWWCILLFTTATQAEHGASSGGQAMVVFNYESQLFASYLPGYPGGKNVQVVYGIDAEDPALIFLTRDAELVTIKIGDVDPQALGRGERHKLKADVYTGHLYKGGSLFYSQMGITFNEQKYFRQIESHSQPSVMQVYDEVNLGRGVRLLVHQINGTPSYDHLLLLYQNISCIKEFETAQLVPPETFLLKRLIACGAMKPVYYDAGALSGQ